MTTSILQTVVARCRQNFTTTSATADLIPGTQRRLTVTAGSYVDLEGVVACSVGAAADTFLNIYVDGAISGEGGAQSTATAADWLQLVARTRIGPVTAAQAAAGILVDLRVATSADTLSITATTTPSKYSAVLTATEFTDTGIVNLPTQIPHCLLWLKADTGVTKDQASGEVTAWVDQSGSRALAYDGGTAVFAVGLTVTGGTSGATGTVLNIGAAEAAGTLVLTDVRGTFIDNEAITDSGTGAAVVNGTASALTVTATAGSAPVYEASVVNSLPGLYFNGNKAANLVVSNTPQQGTAIEVFAVVSVSAAMRAGATLMSPAAASKADCLVVTLSNATVNRNALLDTGGSDEYISTTTTITSGKALMRWRYNVGTTTGGAGVNGNAEVTDATFAPATGIAWKHIGSASAGDFPLGDFRLCELIVYSFFQASTEDAVSSSDIQAIRDYLNARWSVY
ncbi:MAG: hypothetical protein RL409_761 [Gemmatimonadota bacterium]